MDLLRRIYAAGVVGAGGAGFPTHRKLDCTVEYLIINGAECEPLLMTDQYLMRNKGEELICASVMIGELVKASHVIFALKRKYQNEAASLKSAIAQSCSGVEIFFLDGIYPAGDEHVLVHEVTGRTVKPGGIPLSAGVVVVNVNTAYNIYEAVMGKSVISRYMTIAGQVETPVLVKAPIGTPAVECIRAAGGTRPQAYKVIMGGPMMGKMLSSKQLEDRYVCKTDSGIIVLPQDHYMARRASVPIEHIINQAKSVCIQCSYCTELCPRYLLGHRLRPHRIMRAVSTGIGADSVYNEAFLCSECGICEIYACPMGLSPRKVNIYVKNNLRAAGAKPEFPSLEPNSTDMREFRTVPLSRLVSRLDMSGYEGPHGDAVIELQPERVCIQLRQHIGSPAVPVVSQGDRVNTGQLIAAVEYSQTGANIHASIDGIVESVTSSSICINSLR